LKLEAPYGKLRATDYANDKGLVEDVENEDSPEGGEKGSKSENWRQRGMLESIVQEDPKL
jgi:hypothetical protein